MIRNYFQKQLKEKIRRGIIVIDKQAGLTSHDEVDRLRRIFHTRKVGHSGTLDPKVTGVLVCGLGRGTKVLEYVLLSQKIYDAEIVFHTVVDRTLFEQTVQKFTGVISQLPPVKSRVKREVRDREIYGLTLLSFASDGRSAHMRCEVERGTYIRKLCHDMGQSMNIGAHMGELRRIQAGPYSLDNSRVVTTTYLQELKKKSSRFIVGWWYLRKLASYIEPVERALEVLPQVVIHNETVRYLSSGADLFVPGVLKCDDNIQPNQTVVVVDQNKHAVMIGSAVMSTEEIKTHKRGVAVKVQKVLL